MFWECMLVSKYVWWSTKHLPASAPSLSLPVSSSTATFALIIGRLNFEAAQHRRCTIYYLLSTIYYLGLGQHFGGAWPEIFGFVHEMITVSNLVDRTSYIPFLLEKKVYIDVSKIYIYTSNPKNTYHNINSYIYKFWRMSLFLLVWHKQTISMLWKAA